RSIKIVAEIPLLNRAESRRQIYAFLADHPHLFNRIHRVLMTLLHCRGISTIDGIRRRVQTGEQCLFRVASRVLSVCQEINKSDSPALEARGRFERFAVSQFARILWQLTGF
ncbi:MAG TPA: hypothetical protein VFY78_11285, partial [Gammaproteobacteria bacterium]|nr:hypothetical protein [Gammaproteobacteria bacterium]